MLWQPKYYWNQTVTLSRQEIGSIKANYFPQSKWNGTLLNTPMITFPVICYGPKQKYWQPRAEYEEAADYVLRTMNIADNEFYIENNEAKDINGLFGQWSEEEDDDDE